MKKGSFVITIDGPAGSGKSTVAKNLARELGFTYLDTGAMYRALTLKCLNKGVSLENEDEVYRTIHNTDLKIESLPEGTRVIIDGKDVSQEIRLPEVSRNVQHIAKLKRARQALTELQRKFAEGKKIIAEGRDMGTVVFPHALLKFYLDASVEERAKRRAKDLEVLGRPTSLEEIIREIQERDYEDTHRSIAPLKPASDAIILDTTNYSLEEVMALIREKIEEKISLPSHCENQEKQSL